jgi:intracellular multiplication protein IcmE
MSTDFNETPGTPRYRKTASAGGLKQLWGNPIFKLVAVIVVVVGFGVAASQFMGKSDNAPKTVVPVATTSAVSSQAEVTPQYQQAIQAQDAQRAETAAARGESALPTPMQNPVMTPTVDAAGEGQAAKDNLQEFLNIEAASPPPPPAPPMPEMPAYTPEQLQATAGLIRGQTNLLMKGWTPVAGKSLTINDDDEKADAAAGVQQASAPAEEDLGRMVISAGTVQYAQMLMEANSDVPGPVMAQILTGPFAGGRAIGQFQVTRNHLIVTFKTIAYKKKNVSVDILALDPETTLGGVVTEVDPRYMQRVIIPAAAAFVKEYGKVLSTPTSTVTTSGLDGGTTTASTDEPSAKDAWLAGVGEAADRVANFTEQEGAAIKRLVRLEVGAPLGMFYVNPVYEKDIK